MVCFEEEEEMDREDATGKGSGFFIEVEISSGIWPEDCWGRRSGSSYIQLFTKALYMESLKYDFASSQLPLMLLSGSNRDDAIVEGRGIRQSSSI